MILELIGTAFASMGATAGALALRKKLKTAIVPDTYGAIPWLWSSKWHGFHCPKCRSAAANIKQPPICDCLDYPKSHFHFKCNDCMYESIMRTADSNDKA